MRKLLLSALACVAFAGSAFASNEVIDENTYLNQESDTDESKDDSGIQYKYTCNVSIYYTDFWGREQVYTETKYFYFVSSMEGWSMCNNHANAVAQRFRTLSPN